jgi:hypothetical protein
MSKDMSTRGMLLSELTIQYNSVCWINTELTSSSSSYGNITFSRNAIAE